MTIPPTIDVVVRTRNDMPLVERTLDALATQTVSHRLTVFDNASTDGTSQIVRQPAARIIDVPEGGYVPGRILNQAMAVTSSDIVVFLNADCTPVGSEWLARLLEPFTDPKLAAAFGRQVARRGCHPLFARDIESTFGDGSHQARHRHCFSMAASAIRRSAWTDHPFDETLQYSEDVAWTWRVQRLGWDITYVPSAVAVHSHNYSLRQWYRRQAGEGRAEARIFDWTAWQRSLLRYSILPYVAQVARDWRFCFAHRRSGDAMRSPLLRLAQAAGRRSGFHLGLRERRAHS